MFKGSNFFAVVSDVRDCEWGAGEMQTAIGAVPTGKECCDSLVICHSDPGSFLIVYSWMSDCDVKGTGFVKF